MDAARTKEVLDNRWDVEQGDDFKRVAEMRVPVYIRQRRDPCQEIVYGNNRSVIERKSDILKKALEDGAWGCRWYSKQKMPAGLTACASRWWV